MSIRAHAFAEKKYDGKIRFIGYLTTELFRLHNRHFAFLSGINNDFGIPLICEPRGWPMPSTLPEMNFANEELYGWTWFSMAELLSFNYDAEFEDLLLTKKAAHGMTLNVGIAIPGHGRITTYREFLGPEWFNALALLQEKEATRITFCFEGAPYQRKEKFTYVRVKESEFFPIGFKMTHPSPTAPNDGWRRAD